VTPVQPLYDKLPSPNAGPPEFTLSGPSNLSVPQGRSVTAPILTLPRGDFHGIVTLAASGLPEGVMAHLAPSATTTSSLLTLTADGNSTPVTSTVTITGTSGGNSHSMPITLHVTAILRGTVPVNLSSVFNVTGIYTDGTKFAPAHSLDAGGYSLSSQALGSDPVGAGVVFKLGPANAPDAVSSATIPLPKGNFSSLKLLAVGVDGNQDAQSFTVNYTDGTHDSFVQGLSDWSSGADLPGESVATQMPYRLAADGSRDETPFDLFACTFPLNADKDPVSLTLPENRNVVVLAATLVP
jgi:alpha-mannosidase